MDSEGGTTKRVVVRTAVYLWEPNYGWCHHGPDGLDFVDEYHAATLDALHTALARPTAAPRCACGALHVAMHGGHDARCPMAQPTTPAAADG